MKNRSTTVWLTTLMVICAAMACGKEEPPPPAVYPGQVPTAIPPVANTQNPQTQPSQAQPGAANPAPTPVTVPTANPLGTMGQAVGVKPGGTQFPWQSLSKALPVAAPGWTLDGQVKGESAQAMGMSISNASCKLKQGAMTAKVQIMDTTMNPMLAMPFNMARTVRIDSSEERVSPIAFGAHPAVQKLDKRRKKAEVTIMVSNRILVTITVDNATNEAPASTIGQYVNFAHLSKLVGG